METQDGKHLTFALGKEDYGIPILKVREIIGMMEITRNRAFKGILVRVFK